jgi:hypothetical protein
MKNIEKWLLQIRIINRKIKRIKNEIEYLKSRCDIYSPVLNPNKVQSGINVYGFQSSADSIMDKETELINTFQELEEKRNEIIPLLDKLSNPKTYEILYMYYVQEYELKTICEILDITYSWGYKLKKRGVEEIYLMCNGKLLGKTSIKEKKGDHGTIK